MASELRVNTLRGVSTAGSISVVAEGNTNTTNLQQGLAKVWYNVNTTGTLVDSLMFHPMMTMELEMVVFIFLVIWLILLII